MSEKPEGSRTAGGWTTRRDPDGILLYVGAYRVGQKGEDQEKPIWIDKSKAIRLAHTVLEALCRFWDVEIYPEYVRNNTKTLAENVGLEVKEPYREGCPFCQFVADSEDEMRAHLLEEHTITLVFTKEEDVS